ncbi:MAG: L,D-transpeptidase family protein [Chloroflexi bacterium]|nr:L,D-transpeptidase family protein [Chloroflexota bacterium]MBP8055362.1 L,D-transpeptidase family protein [Chloroflexota bacterium]
MTTPALNLLHQAQQALKNGRKQEAYQLLLQAARQDPREYRIWLGLAGLAESPELSLKFIAQAEKLQPDEPKVIQAKSWAQQRLRDHAAASPPTQPFLVPRPAPTTKPIIAPSPQPIIAPTPPSAGPATMITPATPGPVDEPARPAGENRRRISIAAAVMLLVLLFLAAAVIINQNQPSQVVVANTPVSTATLTPTPVGTTNNATRVIAAATPILENGATPIRILPKNIISQNQQPRATWTATPIPTNTSTPTNTPTPTPTPYPTFVGEADPISKPSGLAPGERWIDVNLTTQTLTAWEGDTLALESLVSTGRWQTPTVTGQFRIYLRYEAQNMDGRPLGYDYYLPNVPHVMYFYGDYAIHGAYWHTNFGSVASHGCVNVNLSDAEFLFDWATIGTIVYVHY